MSDTDFTRDELYSIAQEVELTGRADMNKSELRDALEDEAPHLMEPFSDVEDIEVGDWVSMNHLAGDLRVVGILTYTGEEKLIDSGKEDDPQVIETEVTPHVQVVMETVRGGRHALVADKEGETGPSPWKNGEEPHLMRWRAGDEEWMNNSTDPIFIRRLEDEEEDDDES